MLVACTGEVVSGARGATRAGGDASVGEPPWGPYRITCSIYHGTPGSEPARTPIVFMTDTPAEKSVELASHASVKASLAVVHDAPDLVELSVELPFSLVEQHFRLAENEMPPYQLGYQGFRA